VKPHHEVSDASQTGYSDGQVWIMSHEVPVTAGVMDAKGDCEAGGHVSETFKPKDDEQQEIDTSMSSNSFRVKKISEKLKSGAIGQQHAQPREHREKTPTKFSGRDLVNHPYFEAVFSTLIFANTVVVCFEVQYSGFDIGYNINYPTSPNPSAIVWPQAEVWFDLLMFFFGLAFTLEVILKVMFLRLDFPRNTWNLFDTIVVTVWLAEQAGLLANLIFNPNVLRALRLVRLVRLTRMVSIIEALDSLQVLIGSMKACVSILVWSAIVLVVVAIIVGMFLNGFLEPYMTSDDESLSDKQNVYKYFGSFIRTMVTMYEITLGNWVPVTRLLMENVSQVYGPAILVYRFVIGFSMVKVVAGVFLHETFKVAAQDDNLMVVQKHRQTSKMKKKMIDFLAQTDMSGDQKIQKDEFMDILENKWIRTWLASMDLEVADGDILFELTDNGDGEVTAAELFDGFARLKGAARSIDLIGLTYRFSALEGLVEELHAARCQTSTADSNEKNNPWSVENSVLGRELSLTMSASGMRETAEV